MSIKRTEVCSHQEKMTWDILNFGAKGIKYFGPLKMKRKFPYICPTVGQTEGIFTSTVII